MDAPAHAGPPIKNKKHRQMLLIGAAGVLVLLLVMRSRGKSSTPPATAQQATADPSGQLAAGGGGSPYGQPSTFADNGGQAATLGDAVTNSLSGLDAQLQSQTNAFEQLNQTLQDRQQSRIDQPSREPLQPGPTQDAPMQPTGPAAGIAAAASGAAAIAKKPGHPHHPPHHPAHQPAHQPAHHPAHQPAHHAGGGHPAPPRPPVRRRGGTSRHGHH